MKTSITLPVILAVLIGPLAAQAETLRGKMDQVYAAYRSLHPLLQDAAAFSDPKNKKTVDASLSKMSRAFHTADDVSPRFKQQPGFIPTLQLVTDMIADAKTRFAEGKSDYAFWRLRNLSTNCTSCHAAFSPHLYFSDSKEIQASSPLERGDFYSSTRQYEKAKTELIKALEELPDDGSAIDVIRRLLVVQVRSAGVSGDVADAVEKLLPKLKISPYDKEKVSAWITELKHLRRTPPTLDDLSDIEPYMRGSIAGKVLRQPADEIKLLVASGTLHRYLAEKNPGGPERAKALYLLGFAYSQLRQFFFAESPEMYLELCIVEFPGSEEAKASYALYDEIVTLEFTGSRGTDLPTEIKLKLIDLHAKAFNIPAVGGKV